MSHLDNDKEELRVKLWSALRTDKRADTYVIPHRVMELISEVAQAHTQSKLKAFAGEVESSIGIHLSIDKSHTCRFNDGEQNCDCFINGRNDLRDDFREALKAIKEKYNV